MKQSISTLIVMLTISFFVAFLIVIVLVVKYSSPGSYKCQELLLSPKAFNEKVFTYKTPKNGRRQKIRLKKMQFISPSGRYQVNAQAYKQFYSSIRKVKSISQVSSTIADQFNTTMPSTLTIFVYSGDNETGESRVFQQIEFLESSDFFRILVQGEDPMTETWVYFKAPEIFRKANEYFTQKQLSLSWHRWSSWSADGWLQLPHLQESRST